MRSTGRDFIRFQYVLDLLILLNDRVEVDDNFCFCRDLLKDSYGLVAAPRKRKKKPRTTAPFYGNSVIARHPQHVILCGLAFSPYGRTSTGSRLGKTTNCPFW